MDICCPNSLFDACIWTDYAIKAICIYNNNIRKKNE